MVETKHSKTRSVVMLPWLAHGHTTPFLELAKKLSKSNFHIYFCSSTVILTPLKRQLDEEEQFSSSIELIDLNLPSLPSLPPHLHTTKGLPIHLQPTLTEALDSSIPGLLNTLHSLDPDLFIYDFNFPWHIVSSEQHKFNPLREIPAVMFITSSAVLFSFAFHSINHPDTDFPFPEVKAKGMFRTPSKAAAGVEALQEDVGSTRNRVRQGVKRSKIILIKSLREMEGKFFDYLSVLLEKEVVPVGPLVQESHGQKLDDEADELMKWLDKKEKSSTIFVSFGSECFPTTKEIKEIAHGLEMSKVNFIWVVRFPKGEEIEIGEALPDGFLERTEGRGLIVEGWAPQIAILKHPSIGGFVSHCGWGSSMEAMTLGVPIIAMPMYYDQPANAKLVTEIGVGMEIGRNEEEEFERSEIARVIREVVVEKGGEELRRKARELGEKVRNKGEEDMDGGVAQELLQLCSPRKGETGTLV